MSCNRNNSASIVFTLAAGSTTSPYYGQVNITQRLCHSTCISNTPVFQPAFSVQEVAQVGTGQYVVTVKVEGVISYTTGNGQGCCTRSQLISQSFSIPVASAAAPASVTVTAGTTVNAVAAACCQDTSRTFVSETPLVVTVA
ncbi:MAG: hypothetical protein IKV75_01775 [Bacteroidales bacterium]|nr:hypothetical protein [Bacteroidales bacterium]